MKEMKRVVITGATGMIGKKVSARLIESGYKISVLSLNSVRAEQIIPGAAEYVDWNLKSRDWYYVLENKDAVIHLAGENIMSKRWTDTHKKNIISSRVDTTHSMVDAINNAVNKPKVFISASAVGYYGNSEKEVDEYSAVGNDFLAHVVEMWESSSIKLPSDIRRVYVRIGMVLDKSEGVLAKMIPPFKYFVGGPLGSGNQWFPWVHIDDVVGIFLFALENAGANGVLNAGSPNPVRMKEFCKKLGSVTNRPSLINVPGFVLKFFLGEAADAILSGAKVIPKRTEQAGYKFIFTELKSALENLIRK